MDIFVVYENDKPVRLMSQGGETLEAEPRVIQAYAEQVERANRFAMKLYERRKKQNE